MEKKEDSCMEVLPMNKEAGEAASQRRRRTDEGKMVNRCRERARSQGLEKRKGLSCETAGPSRATAGREECGGT